MVTGMVPACMLCGGATSRWEYQWAHRREKDFPGSARRKTFGSWAENLPGLSFVCGIGVTLSIDHTDREMGNRRPWELVLYTVSLALGDGEALCHLNLT